MAIASLYADFLSLGGEGVVFEAALEAPPQEEPQQKKAVMPGGKDDKFHTDARGDQKEPGKEQESQARVVAEKLGLDKVRQLAFGDNHENTFGDKSSVSVKYGTSFNRNMELQSVKIPHASQEPYLLILGVDSKGPAMNEEDLYDAVVLVDARQTDSSTPETIEVQSEVPASDPPPAPPPEEPEEYGDSSDSNPDVYYSINYIESVDTSEPKAATAAPRTVEVEAEPAYQADRRQSYVRGVRPTMTSGGTRTGGGGSAY